MADKVSGGVGSVASQAGGMTGTPLGGVVGMAQAGVEGLFNGAHEILDKWFPPEKREQVKNKIMKFIAEKPQFAGFLFCQLALSGIPLALFFTMSLSVLVFALLVGLIVGVLGAVLFTVFCLGVALIVLLPILFLTTFGASFVFLWGLGTYYIIKWFNKKDVPGIHGGFMDGMNKQTGADNLPALNGEAVAPAGQNNQEEKPAADNNDASHADSQNSGGGDQEKKPSKSKSPPATKRSQTPSGGKGTGIDHGSIGNVKKTAGGTFAGATAAVNG